MDITTLNKGVWRQLSDLEVARSHPAVAVYKDRLYVFGGGGPNFQSLDSSVVYDPKTDNWSELSPMPTRRSGTVAFTVGDQIYIIGGGFKKPDGNFQFLRTVEIYHPDTDSWSSGPDMLMPHDYPAAARLGDDIYVLGGHHPDACLGGPKTDPGFAFCERLNLTKGHWEQLADMPTPRFAASGFVIDGKVMASGGVAFSAEGFHNFDFIETFDPSTGNWARETALTLPWTAAGHGTCIFRDHVCTFGGFSTDDIHPRAAYYEPEFNQWIALPDMPIPRAAMGVGLIGDTIYLVGGWASDGRTPVNTVVAYTA